MSHIVTLELEINDLSALEKAAENLGCELVRGQKTYKWYGESVGDYPLPEGMTAGDLGKCDHAIRVKGNPDAYEIGVVESKTKRGAYSLAYDFWNDGYGLMQKVGANAGKLKQEYTVQALIRKTAGRRSVRSISEKVDGLKRKITILLR